MSNPVTKSSLPAPRNSTTGLWKHRTSRSAITACGVEAFGYKPGGSNEKRILCTALIFAAVLTAAPALSQTPPARVRGTIEKIDGSNLTIKARDGSSVNVKLADNPRITAMVKASLDDIKAGTFIGVTAMPQPDGSQKAIGIHIFMDNQRGVVPARFSPWDREPGSTMTNADVSPPWPASMARR